ncbi:MAG TPA: diaminopimelate epimerase [Tepidisphaeraceae bacterium]|jgi:diaminopimelate epimerase
MKFTKMHGIGNDYVYVNGFEETVDDPAALARIIADRHTGVGGDGLILVLPSEQADVRMRMFNADGSESEMCGNGVRCVAKYAFDHKLSDSNPMEIETGRGVLTLALDVVDGEVETVTVDMGEPILELAEIPVVQGAVGRNAHFVRKADHLYSIAQEIDGNVLQATFVSMGNPHAVFFVDDVDAIDLPKYGPKLEHYPAFPKRMNVHFAQVIGRDEVKMRTWERGSGITLACGTGACAVAVAGVLHNKTDRKVLAHLPGGDLLLEWHAENDHVYMSGPATEVFTGEWIG